MQPQKNPITYYLILVQLRPWENNYTCKGKKLWEKPADVFYAWP
jgi:hypothetical protein